MNRRALLRGLGAAALAAARPALAYDAPVVRFNMTAWNAAVPEQATWTYLDENGTVQGVEACNKGAVGAGLGAADPVTGMLQSAWNYAAANALPFVVTGRSYRVSDGQCPFLCTFAPITAPASGDTRVEFNNVIWLQRPNGNGLIFDSSELLDFRFSGGEMLYRGAHCPVLLQPKTQTPTIDNNLSINSGLIDISSITVQAGSSSLAAIVGIDSTYGFIGNMRLRFGQMAAGGFAQNGILIWQPGSPVHDLDIDAAYIVGVTQAGAQIGESAAPTLLYDINARVLDISPAGGSADCFRSFQNGGSVHISRMGDLLGSSYNRGIVLEPGSANVHYSYELAWGAAGGAVVNQGTGNVAC